MVEIALTKGKVAIVDDCDAHLAFYNWYFLSNGYAIRKFRKQDGKQGNLWLHHCVLGYPLKGLQIDHIDGDRLNNRRSNLRFVTIRENAQNKKCHRNGSKSSKYIGVYWHKRDEKWRAAISIGKIVKFLGDYDSEEQAASVYQEKLKQLAVN